VGVAGSLSACDALKDAARSSITATPAPTGSTTSSRPSPSTTTATRPPAVMPSRAKQKTKDGAKAFTIFFWSQFNRSNTEPNPTLLPPLYADSCAPCVAYTAGAQALRDRSQRYDGPPFRITKVTTDTLKGDTATVVTEADQQAVPVVDEQGNTAATATQRDLRFLVTVAWNGSGWLVGNIEIIK
jgi:hypothetical protein